MVEFAVCLPFLILVFQYINDLIKIGHLNSQVEFVGYSSVNLLQELPQSIHVLQNQPSPPPYLVGRPTRLLPSDLKNIFSAVWLHWSPIAQFYYVNNFQKVFPMTIIYYVKGEAVGAETKATCLWGVKLTTCDAHATSPENIQISAFHTAAQQPKASTIYWGTLDDPKKIHKDLQIDPGKYKVIVESMLVFKKQDNMYSEAKKACNLDLTIPPHKVDSNTGDYIFTPHVITYAPVPAAFGDEEEEDIDPISRESWSL